MFLKARNEKTKNSPLIIVMLLILCYHGCRQSSYIQSAGKYHLQRGPAYSGHFQAITTGDLNGDGHIDLIGGKSSSSGQDLVIWYGNGMGTWRTMVRLPIHGAINSLALGDINNDGRKDICLSIWEETTGISVWLNLDENEWQEALPPTETGLYNGVCIYDINQDESADILAANYSTRNGRPEGIHIWLGDNKGNWMFRHGPTSRGRFANIIVEDFNHDGNPDLAATSWGLPEKLLVWLGRAGMQNWAAMPPLDSGSFWGIRSADFNNDGNPDLVATTYQEGVKVYYGYGTGIFSEPQILIDNGHFWEVQASDINNDGWPDIIASSFDNKGIKLWINGKHHKRTTIRKDDEKSFYKKWAYKNTSMKSRPWEQIEGALPNFGSFYDMAVADFNQDGYMDLAAAHRGEGIKVWQNLIFFDHTDERIEAGYIDSNTRGISAAQLEKEIIPKVHYHKRELPEELVEKEGNLVYRVIDGIPEYIIGGGDTIEVTIWEGMHSNRFSLPVKLNGTISTPFFDNFKMAGFTSSEADAALTEKMKKFINNPRLDVRVTEFKSKKVTLLGAIHRTDYDKTGPGIHYLQGKTKIIEFLSQCGGTSRDADLRQIEIIRKGKTHNVNLYSVIQGNFLENIILDHEDVIFIPTINESSSRVFIFGEIGSPGIYPFSGSFTLLEALAEAGGYSEDACLSSIKVVRGDISNPEVISCDFNRLVKKGDITQNIHLCKNDLIFVPKRKIVNMNKFADNITSLLRLVLYPVALVNTFRNPEDINLQLDLGYK
ncbi:MAG: FG-GAP-like repeat-containing protein [bacterium]